LFASRIRSTGEAVGVETILVRSADALVAAAAEQQPARIFLDLDARAVDPPTLIRRLKATDRTADIELIAFVSHVREDAIAAARAAGADQVLARSAFVRQLPTLIAG
jgi:CheY-like chemotaxis protein